MGVGTTAAGFNFVITILNLRAPGVTLMRMPLFAWMTLIVSFLIIFAFPPLTIALIFLLFDRFFATNFFDTVGAGADPLLWQHLFWVFGHPEVYILILPAMGIVSDILPTFSRKPLFGYTTVVFRRRGDRLPRLWRVGAPHVHDGHRRVGDCGLRSRHHGHRRAHRREDIQLAGDPLGRGRSCSGRLSCSPSASSACSCSED